MSLLALWLRPRVTPSRAGGHWFELHCSFWGKTGRLVCEESLPEHSTHRQAMRGEGLGEPSWPGAGGCWRP